MRCKADEYQRRQDKLNLENPSKRKIFAKKSPNVPRRPRIWLNFISVKLPRPPRSGSRSRAWTHRKMMCFQITSNDKVSHFKIAYTCDTLHRSIQFQTWNLHKNAWNFIKLHRPTQFQTWNLHKNMINCIARHNFKLGNDVFSNENGGPGFLDFCCLYLSSKCIKRESSKSDPANFGTITRHTFPLALTQKVNKCHHFGSSSIPFPLDFVRLSALENRMGELKVRPGQFLYYNSTHFRTSCSTKNA